MEEDAFSAFERRGWEHLAQSYHSYYADLTTQSNDALLDALEVGPGTRFLDVATGPGYVAAAAAARGAEAVGVDFAAAMVDQARRLCPGLTFRVGSAEDLPFPDAGFDAVGSSRHLNTNARLNELRRSRRLLEARATNRRSRAAGCHRAMRLLTSSSIATSIDFRATRT
jgi:ubiquinone/menaquinone biosynthesis C-methylase UbiE